jgi:drug/metabolite transporter (DMT)-like permease
MKNFISIELAALLKKGVVMTQQNNLKVLLAFAAIYLIWGSTYLALRIGVETVPPFFLSALRFTFAGVLLYIWCLWKGEEQPDFSSLKKNAICGILMLFGGTSSVAWAEQYLPSSLTAIIVTSMPFWFILLDKKQWSFYFSNKLLLTGLIIGFIGVAILVRFDTSSHSFQGDPSMRTYAVIAVIAGGIAWTTGSLYSKYSLAKNSVLMNASLQLIIAGAFSLGVSVFSGELDHFNLRNTTTSAWTALLYLVTMGSIIAYLSYLWLLKVRPVAQVSTYVYINPIVAVLLGAIIANERITWIQITGLAIILSGVFLVNIAKNGSKKLKKNFMNPTVKYKSSSLASHTCTVGD